MNATEVKNTMGAEQEIPATPLAPAKAQLLGHGKIKDWDQIQLHLSGFSSTDPLSVEAEREVTTKIRAYERELCEVLAHFPSTIKSVIERLERSFPRLEKRRGVIRSCLRSLVENRDQSDPSALLDFGDRVAKLLSKPQGTTGCPLRYLKYHEIADLKCELRKQTRFIRGLLEEVAPACRALGVLPAAIISYIDSLRPGASTDLKFLLGDRDGEVTSTELRQLMKLVQSAAQWQSAQGLPFSLALSLGEKFIALEEEQKVHTDQMFAANQRLLVKYARYQSNRSKVSVEDLMQEGQFAFFKAIHAFEPERGLKFSTFVNKKLLQRIRYAVDINAQGDLIHRGAHVRTAERKLSSVVRSFEAAHGRKPSDAEIKPLLKKLALGIDIVKKSIRLSGVGQMSIDDEQDGFNFASITTGEKPDAALAKIATGDAAERLKQFIAESLKPKEQLVIYLKFVCGLTDEAIGSEYGGLIRKFTRRGASPASLGSASINTIYKKALKKLQRRFNPEG